MILLITSCLVIIILQHFSVIQKAAHKDAVTITTISALFTQALVTTAASVSLTIAVSAVSLGLFLLFYHLHSYCPLPFLFLSFIFLFSFVLFLGLFVLSLRSLVSRFDSSHPICNPSDPLLCLFPCGIKLSVSSADSWTCGQREREREKIKERRKGV